MGTALFPSHPCEEALRSTAHHAAGAPVRRGSRPRKLLRLMSAVVISAAAATLFASSVVSLSWNDRGTQLDSLPLWPLAERASSTLRPYSLVNSYGLFRRMTGVEARPEVALEGSMDGKVWKEMLFKYKPTLPDRSPPFIGRPHARP